MKKCGGVEIGAHVFLSSALHGVNGQLDSSAAYPRETTLRSALDRRLGEFQNQSGRCGVERNPCEDIARTLRYLAVHVGCCSVDYYWLLHTE
jgi:hypothetical protein